MRSLYFIGWRALAPFREVCHLSLSLTTVSWRGNCGRGWTATPSDVRRLAYGAPYVPSLPA